MDVPFESLLDAATRAPSGDNTQPWRFVIERATRSITLELDPQRDPSPMNAGQRMARIAAGAALENLQRAARAHGLETIIEPGPRLPALATVRLVGDASTPVEGNVSEATALLATITARVTNRRVYDGRPIPNEMRDRLVRASADLEGVRTVWIIGSDRIAALAPVIGRADALMFGEPAMRRAFLANVRFDAAADAEVDEGLSFASLEVSAADRLALRVMRAVPDRLLALGRPDRVFDAKARRLILSSSGLCVVAAPDGAEATDLLVGRALQRAWLALTAEGLAAQPMMSLPVLENARENGDVSLQETLGHDRITALGDDFRALVPELAGGRPAWVMRFGFAPPPSGRTGRRPLEAASRWIDPPEGARRDE